MPDDVSAPEAVVRKQVRAYDDRDVDAFVECFAEDAVVSTLESATVIADGKAELREQYSETFADSPDLEAQVTDRLVRGDFVVDRVAMSGLEGDNSPTVLAIYRVEDGSIQRYWFEF